MYAVDKGVPAKRTGPMVVIINVVRNQHSPQFSQSYSKTIQQDVSPGTSVLQVSANDADAEVSHCLYIHLIFRENWVSIRTDDVLVPCFTRSSAAMVLTKQYTQMSLFHEENFKRPTTLQFWEMTENAPVTDVSPIKFWRPLAFLIDKNRPVHVHFHWKQKAREGQKRDTDLRNTISTLLFVETILHISPRIWIWRTFISYSLQDIQHCCGSYWWVSAWKT